MDDGLKYKMSKLENFKKNKGENLQDLCLAKKFLDWKPKA